MDENFADFHVDFGQLQPQKISDLKLRNIELGFDPSFEHWETSWVHGKKTLSFYLLCWRKP